MTWIRTLTRRALNVLLTLLALLGLAGAALFVAVQTGHLQTFMFVSGSMSPTFDRGDAVVSRRVNAFELLVDDVVTVPGRDGIPVTHRVVAIEETDEGPRRLTLRGDANDADDPFPYLVSEAFVPVLRLPRGGDIIVAVREPWIGIPMAVGAVSFVLLVMTYANKADAVPVPATDPLPSGPPTDTGDDLWPDDDDLSIRPVSGPDEDDDDGTLSGRDREPVSV